MVLLNGMKNRLVPIDAAGRIVLPKFIRQELAIHSGDKLVLSVNGSSVILTPTKATAGFMRKGKALVFSTAEEEALTEQLVHQTLEDTRGELGGTPSRSRPPSKHSR